MRATWNGHYLSGRTPERVPVIVTIERRGLRLDRRDGSSTWWPYHAVRLTQGFHAGEHVRLERDDTGEALVVVDRAFLDALHELVPEANRALPRVSRSFRARRLALIAAAALAAAAGLYVWILPAAAAAAARRVPAAWEQEMGDALAAELAPAGALCDDTALTPAVDGIVARLAAALPETRYTFRVSIVDDSLVNAFAAPGGRIVLFHGLLRNTARPEELAGVLAHEMQHVQLRHGTRAVLRQIPVRAVVAAVGGELVGARRAAEVIGTLGVLRYARGDEEEADREGMRLLLAARVDPQGMLAFFDTLERQTDDRSAGLSYLSTHPPTAARRARLAALAAESSVRPVPITTPREPWTSLTARCRAAAGSPASLSAHP